MTTNAQELVQALIQDDPKVHDWGAGLVSGGLGGEILRCLASYLLEELGEGQFKSLETGAGLSTLVFAAAGPAQHLAINPDTALRERVIAEANARKIDMATTTYITQFSEDVLPDLAKAHTVDIALIDGGHGWPTVFVDFCYANKMLRQNGIMVVDDIFLFPCTQLFMLLKHQPGWKLEKLIHSKTAFFRKEYNQVRLPDFGGEPYLKNNMILG